MWSFVGNKNHRQWLWLAQDRVSKEIVGVYVGSRDEEGAIGLWQSLPEAYLEATTYTDDWEAYRAIFYDNKLHQVGKESGQTNHVERFNNTLRQRVSRLGRKTLSFSKKLETTLGRFGISSTTTINHYLFSTTQKKVSSLSLPAGSRTKR